MAYTPGMCRQALILISLCAVALAQAPAAGPAVSNSVTVSVSRYTNPQPDQLVFGISVQSGLDVTMDQVLAALKAAGITGASLTGLGSTQQYSKGQATGLALNWNFSLAAPLSGTATVAVSLAAAQTALANGNPPLTMSFGPQGTQVSAQLQAAQSCAAADLIADARTKAQTLAAAAGQTLGGVLAISSASSATNIGASGVFTSPTYFPVCQATVKFALGTAAPSDSDALSIAASRSTTLAADQVVVGVYVNASPAITLDQVVSALEGLGITAANLSGASTGGTGAQSLTQWYFNLPVPFAQLKATLAALSQAEQNPGNAVLTVGFAVQGTQVSQQLQAAQTCSYAALVADAQAVAQKLAVAAGIAVGPVIAVSDGTAPVAAVFQSGDFSAIIDVPSPGVFLQTNVTNSVPSTCSLAVQFKVQH